MDYINYMANRTYTTISIDPETRRRLGRMGRASDSKDNVVRKLIKFYEQHKELDINGDL